MRILGVRSWKSVLCITSNGLVGLLLSSLNYSKFVTEVAHVEEFVAVEINWDGE